MRGGIVLDEIRRVVGYSDDTRSRPLLSQQVIIQRKFEAIKSSKSVRVNSRYRNLRRTFDFCCSHLMNY